MKKPVQRMIGVPSGVIDAMRAQSIRELDALGPMYMLYLEREKRFVPRDEMIARDVEHKAREWLKEFDAMRLA